MPSELRWRITWQGEEYEWRQYTDLTLSRLRHFKQWFGPEYGNVAGFNRLWLLGDGDAYACVIWAVQKAAGKSPPEPRNMPDFAVGEIYNEGPLDEIDEDETDEGEQEVPPTSARTSGSKGTRTSSEPSG